VSPPRRLARIGGVLVLEHWHLSLATSTEYSTSTVPVSGIRPLLHNYPVSEERMKPCFIFRYFMLDTCTRVPVWSGGTLASHEFGLFLGCIAGWCLRLTFASSSARGMGHTSQLWRSLWEYMVCVLGSSSLCAWSDFMRDASRLDSSFFLLPFYYFPSSNLESLCPQLTQYNCHSRHRTVAYFTFGYFLFYLVPFQLSNLSLVYSEFVFLIPKSGWRLLGSTRLHMLCWTKVPCTLRTP